MIIASIAPPVISSCHAYIVARIASVAGEWLARQHIGEALLASGGGVDHLKQLRPVFPDVVFCPTGGLTFNNVGAFLALDNVVCVGGSFADPAAAVATSLALGAKYGVTGVNFDLEVSTGADQAEAYAAFLAKVAAGQQQHA